MSQNSKALDGRRAIKRVLLTLLSTVVALSFAELGLRVVCSVENARVLEFLESDHQVPAPGKVVKFGELLRSSPDPEIVYSLIPNIDRALFLNTEVSTNSLGFRSADIKTKERDAIRVLGIGDSVMFGWGVAESETYLELAVERLRREQPQFGWDLVNTAVPGYNTVMEVATLREKGLALKPDIVVLGWINNDLILPNWLNGADPLRTDRSFLKQVIERSLNPPLSLREVDPGGEVHPEHRHLVGRESAEASFRELQELSIEHGFRVIVITFQESEQVWLEQIWTELGFEVVLGSLAIDRYIEENGHPSYPESPLSIPDDGHPSVIGHQLFAKVLFEALNKQVVESSVR